MIIKQEIPSRDFCMVSENAEKGIEPEKCIFLDRSSFLFAQTNNFICRRNPDLTLGTENINGILCVVKCRACMADCVVK